MKKTLLSATILIMFAFVGLCAIADTTEKDKGYISVSSSSSQEVSPNQAEISLSIETSDKTMQKASEDNKKIANSVYSSLKSLLGKDDYIKTNNYSAHPQYIYTKENKKIFDKYVVTNSVVVRTKNTSLVPKLIDTAIAQGATGVNNLRFSASNYDEACNGALAELTKKTYTQADTVAKSINAQIAGIKSIDTSCNSENNSMPYAPMMANKAMDGMGATPIESGKIKIFANISAAFYVR